MQQQQRDKRDKQNKQDRQDPQQTHWLESMPGVSEAESSDPDLMSYLTTLVNQSKRNVAARPEFLRRYSAKATTEQQSNLFDEVLRRHQDHGAYRAWSPGVSRAS